MKGNFSEFSYGYAVTEELALKYKGSMLGAPQFPSLQEEGKKGGYDVKLPTSGKAVFLQFKLSDHLSRDYAREHKNGVLDVPYFRMHLRPARHSRQHALLCSLEESGESVFYIAPEFHQPFELNKHYLSKTVVNNSAAFSPKDIGPLPDGKDHYVVFKRGQSVGYMCSDKPSEVPKLNMTDGFRDFVRVREVKSRTLDEDGLYQIADRMIGVLERYENTLPRLMDSLDVEGIRRIIDDRGLRGGLSYMTRTFFDSELVIVPD